MEAFEFVSQEEARRKLRQLVYTVRRQLAKARESLPDLFESTRTTLQLHPEMLKVDALEMERLLRLAEQSSDLGERTRRSPML